MRGRGHGGDTIRGQCLDHSVQGELRWGWNKGDCVGWSLNCPIDPHHSCARHTSPVFPKRIFCETQEVMPRDTVRSGRRKLWLHQLCCCASCLALGEEREAAFVRTAIAGAPWDIRVGPGESGLCPNQAGGGIREPPALLLLWAALLLVAFPLSTSLQFVSPTWAHSILCFFLLLFQVHFLL